MHHVRGDGVNFSYDMTKLNLDETSVCRAVKGESSGTKVSSLEKKMRDEELERDGGRKVDS